MKTLFLYGEVKLIKEIQRLIDIAKLLRDPKDGCPWDLEQTFRSIAPHAIEEAYEVADAIDNDDIAGLNDELGDLLFQIVFLSQIADEKDFFNFNDVARNICIKMIRRHPHIFGDENIETPEAQSLAWENIKAIERRKKQQVDPDIHGQSALSGVASALPSLTRAQKIQKRAAREGFDWPKVNQVFEKIDEEILEIKAEIKDNSDVSRLEDEVGDLLFCCVNLARKLGVESEIALKKSSAKFEFRFRAMEKFAEEKKLEFSSLGIKEMEELWRQAKKVKC